MLEKFAGTVVFLFDLSAYQMSKPDHLSSFSFLASSEQAFPPCVFRA